ncbi:MAG: hypothetical protein WBW55_06220 [Desulfobaccales bacterium]
MESKIGNFLMLFSKLRNETNNSPTNLSWLLTSKPNLAELCWDLNYQYREISKLLIKKHKKHTIVPPSFPKKWDEYKKIWEKIVAEGAKSEAERFSKELYEIWLTDFEAELTASGKIPEEVYKEKGKTPEELYQFAWEYLDVENDHEERLDLLEENPATIMNELYSYVNDYLVDDEDKFINNKHLEAWDFFADSIGIDYSKTYARWQSAPQLFITYHMESRTNITPIQELYNEAVRAYIFGLTEASVAMCRALMEYILTKYYHASGNNLADIISSAERQHKYLKDLKLHSKRSLANKVLHDYEKRVQEIEKAAFDFLRTIQHLVNNIPSP